LRPQARRKVFIFEHLQVLQRTRGDTALRLKSRFLAGALGAADSSTVDADRASASDSREQRHGRHSAEHLDLARYWDDPQSREPALRQRGHGRVAFPTEETPAELRACDAGGATAGIWIAHEFARLREVGDQLARQPERLLRRMDTSLIRRNRVPVDALLAAAIPALLQGSAPARLVGDELGGRRA
jgi:hypothetical protein